jgi:plastocyanin
VRPRKRHLLSLPALVALGLLLPGGPAHGQALTSAAIVATDYRFTAVDGGPANVVVAVGGHVDFAYPTGASYHNVTFTGKQPSVCGISQGPDSGSAAPLPREPTGPGWEGGCTFGAAGAYSFVCGLHSDMTGSVSVVAAGSPPALPPPTPPPPPPADVAPAASGLRVTSRQRGVVVRGSVRVRSGGSRLLARAFARRKALGGGSSTRQVAVGRSLRSSVGSGRAAFTVSLGATARRALRRSGRLAISLRVTVTPSEGAPYTATKSVVLRRR